MKKVVKDASEEIVEISALIPEQIVAFKQDDCIYILANISHSRNEYGFICINPSSLKIHPPMYPYGSKESSIRAALCNNKIYAFDSIKDMANSNF